MADATFEQYVSSLGRLTARVDPTLSTPPAEDIREAVATLTALEGITVESLTAWSVAHPKQTYVLALAAGLSQEKLKNLVRSWFGTGSWAKAVREDAPALIAKLDEDFDLVRLVATQRGRAYTFSDVLVARAGTRATATSAGASGRRIEDEIEAIAHSLHLPYRARTRFTGRSGRTGPADLALPTGGSDCLIAVAAKGFDSTGSKLSDAVREIEEMADVRTGGQVALAVVDGIGWKGRMADLKRIWSLWDRQQIDGLYTLATLDRFRVDLDRFATLRAIGRVGDHSH